MSCIEFFDISSQPNELPKILAYWAQLFSFWELNNEIPSNYRTALHLKFQNCHWLKDVSTTVEQYDGTTERN